MATESAGILIFRRSNGKAEVLLVHPGGPFWTRKDVWSIPKGELDPGEDHLAAAKREFAEETSLPLPSGQFIDLGLARQNGNKTNFIWAIEGNPNLDSFQSNTCMIEWPPRSGKQLEIPEVDRGAWFDLVTAHQKIYTAQQIFIERLAQHLGEVVDTERTQQSLL